VRTKRQNGIALITVLLIMLLVSAVVVGMSWMVMTDQRLGGNNLNRDLAFYGAEAGMEKLTADMGNQFAIEGALTGTDVTTIEGKAPAVTGLSYTNASGGSTYQILCGSPLANCTTPTATTSQVLPPSPYSGMNATITPFTLSVTASELGGGEVKLERNVQLVAIPVFQFGIYSDSDLAFFNGPSFDFGGRVHTNGNLWLAPNSGPLYLADKVTVAGQIIRTNLENGYPSGSTLTPSTDYSGTVSVALTPTPSTLPPSTSTPPYSNTQWWPLDTTDSSVSGSSVYGAVSTTTNKTPTWYTSTYSGMLINDVTPLSLTSTALGGLSQPISLIRRPVSGEATSNPTLFTERYFSQATLRILLDDYATPGVPSSGCSGSDMMNLSGDGISSTTPTDLTSLTNIAKSGGTSNSAYTLADGYWVTGPSSGTYYPTISGCIKIEYQDSTGTFHDYTSTMLGSSYGYRGRNINPQPSSALSASTGTACQASACTHAVSGQLLALPVIQATTSAMNLGSTVTNASLGANYKFPNYKYSSGTTAAGSATKCVEPDPGAIIRIERIRDNPSNEYSHYVDGCGDSSTQSTALSTHGIDYWPMVLFDTREAVMRGVQTASTDVPQNSSNNPQLSAMGVMDYIELDVSNLAAWLNSKQSTLTLNNNTGYTVYFSDRRGEQIDNTAVVGTSTRTGSFGYNDIVNGTSDPTNGCPDGSLSSGEDFEGDGVLRTYGGTETTIPNLFTGLLASTSTKALVKNSTFSLCTALGNTWPGALYVNIQEARENPPVFFRRALKLVDGNTITAGTTCFTGGTPACGLTIASENPVYIEGDYNTNSSVAASVAADAVTLLSDGWNDVNSFISPYTSDARPGFATSYRVALIGGKGIPFAQPSGAPEDFGTDGGLHNFLRYLENLSPPTGIGYPSGVATGGQTITYTGSLVSFFYNRQAIGEYKGDVDTVYSPPTRAYSFDTNFTLGTQYLPPRTPVLRTINTTGFTQEINPTQ
jgi:hypothetical protein